MCSIDSFLPTPCSQPAPEPPSLAELEREICELAAHIAAATCRWLMLLAEFDERGGWAEWGCVSCAHWLSWRCSLAPGAARERVRVARSLRALPLVQEAFATGELSFCKVRALTRVATAETELELVEIARHATGAQLEQLVRGYRGALAATLDGARAIQSRRYFRWNWNEDGSLAIEGRLSPEDGAILIAAVQGHEQAVDRIDDISAETRTHEDVAAARPANELPDAGARRADGLVAAARSALTADPDATSAGYPCEIVVHIDADTLGRDELVTCSELADGPSLAPETIRRLGCDAALVAIVERDGRPLSVGRRTRTIPPALRRALRRRDGGGCRFPGCTHRRFLHAHHIHHWANGGRTTLDNLVHLCSHHHRLVHEDGFRVERAGSGSVRFRRPDGRAIPAAVPASPATGPRLESRHREDGLVVAPHTCRPRSAGDRLDYGLAVEVLLSRTPGLFEVDQIERRAGAS